MPQVAWAGTSAAGAGRGAQLASRVVGPRAAGEMVAVEGPPRGGRRGGVGREGREGWKRVELWGRRGQSARGVARVRF